MLNLVLDVESKLLFVGARSAPDGSSPRVYGRVLAAAHRLKLYYSKILMLMLTPSGLFFFVDELPSFYWVRDQRSRWEQPLSL